MILTSLDRAASSSKESPLRTAYIPEVEVRKARFRVRV